MSTRPFDGPELMPEAPVGSLADTLVDEVHGPVARAQLLDDRLERLRRPVVRSKDPEELEAAIERIPLPERRVAWRKAIYGQFSDEELKESQRRVARRASACSRRRSPSANGSPVTSTAWPTSTALTSPTPCHWRSPTLSNDELTPNILRWLRAIYARPATKACWALGRTSMVKRVAILEQPHIGTEPRHEPDDACITASPTALR